jgi:hypothetical protein
VGGSDGAHFFAIAGCALGDPVVLFNECILCDISLAVNLTA